jgi:hypothetical protein
MFLSIFAGTQMLYVSVRTSACECAYAYLCMFACVRA